MTPRDNSPTDLDLEAIEKEWTGLYLAGSHTLAAGLAPKLIAEIRRLQAAPRTGEGLPEPEQSPSFQGFTEFQKAELRKAGPQGYTDVTGRTPPPGAKEGPKPAGLEGAIPALLELARNEPHDDVECPEDDTCRCENIAKLNADFEHVAYLLSRASQPQHQEDVSEADYVSGKDCPKGMVQVEFVGCDPKNRQSKYGWKPEKSAFLEIYVDGHRFRVDVGDYATPRQSGKRRGLHVCGPIGLKVDKHSVNALDIYLDDAPEPTDPVQGDGSQP